MPAKKSRVALKTALLAPAGPVVAWGIQKLLGGEPTTGAIAVLLGIGLVGAFVVVQEYDLPYEEKIVALIKENSEQLSEDALKDISEEAAAEAEKRDLDLSSVADTGTDTPEDGG